MPSFPLAADHQRHHPKLPSVHLCRSLVSFLKSFSRYRFHAPLSSSSLSLEDDGAAAGAGELDLQHVIIFEVRHRAMLKAMSRPEGIVIAAAEGISWKVGGDGKMEGRVEGYEGDDESEEFFSVRSCFSMCSVGSGGGEGCWWEERGRFWGRKAAASAWDEWFKQCEGWPFGLWRRRPPPVVVVLPPLPRSPADSWTWHKRNLSSTAKACAVWAAT